MEELQRQKGGEDWAAIKALKGDFEVILENEDMKWKQRTKQSWYKHADRNTPFFRAWTNHRRKINWIEKIKDEEGREWKK